MEGTEPCKAADDIDGNAGSSMKLLSQARGGKKAATSDCRPVPQISQKNSSKLPLDEVNCYRMTSDPAGFALVIKNDTFKGEKEFFGMDKTVAQLQDIFRHLNFQMEVYENLTGQELFNRVEEFSQRSEHASVDSCALVIISHGSRDDVISGTDGNWCPFQKLKDLFNARNAPHLAGKPKLFLVEACRGLGQDEVMFAEVDGNRFAEVQHIAPKQADMLVINATTPGDTALQNVQHGGCLFPEMRRVFLEEASTTDALKMLTKVNSRISETEIYDRGTKRHFKAMSSIEFTLRKDWYFAPYWQQKMADVH